MNLEHKFVVLCPRPKCLKIMNRLISMRPISIQILKELPVLYLIKIALLLNCSYVIKKKSMRCESHWPLEGLFMTRIIHSSNRNLLSDLKPPTHRNTKKKKNKQNRTIYSLMKRKAPKCKI